jgi:hypothetical protein
LNRKLLRKAYPRYLITIKAAALTYAVFIGMIKDAGKKLTTTKESYY